MIPLENNQFLEKVSKHPLFKGLLETQFKQLISSCQIKTYAKTEIVLYSKTSRDGLLLLIDGMVEVYVEQTSSSFEEEVLEVLQAGELIGLSSIADFLGEPTPTTMTYNVGVRAIEDSYCLHLPFTVLEERWNEEQVRDYILRRIAVRLKDVYCSLAEQVQLASQWGESEAFIRRVQDLMSSPFIYIEHSAKIHEIAQQMSTHSISSVGVFKNQTLVGMITESDLVRRMTTIQALDRPAEEYMTPNPHTISRHAYYYEALSLFLMNRIKHLPVTDQGKIVGMITLSDLLRKKNRGMLEILQTIEQSQLENIAQIKQAIYYVLSTLLHDGIPMVHTLEVITKLYDRLVKHCIELAIQALQVKGHGPPPVSFCWFQMGSAGRKEQFFLTDQDHFLVYEDISQSSESKQSDIERYFANLTEETVAYLEQAGFAKCKGNMMASAAEWRGSLTSWGERLRRWTLRSTNDNVLLSHNFFSFRYLYGDQELHAQFIQTVKEQLKKSSIFLYRMATLEKESPVPVVDRPIRSLFRLERKEIDLKKDVLFPFHHSLQILSLYHGVFEGTPLQRIEKLVELHAMTASFADDLKMSYGSLMKIRVEHAWSLYKRDEKSTSVLPIIHLTSHDKGELIHSLKTIHSLQQHTLATFGM